MYVYIIYTCARIIIRADGKRAKGIWRMVERGERGLDAFVANVAKRLRGHDVATLTVLFFASSALHVASFHSRSPPPSRFFPCLFSSLRFTIRSYELLNRSWPASSVVCWRRVYGEGKMNLSQGQNRLCCCVDGHVDLEGGCWVNGGALGGNRFFLVGN